MAKKSFKTTDNSVMQFISQESVDKVERKPAEIPTPTVMKAPAGYRPNPAFIEMKSRRVQALIQPSVYEAVKAKASRAGISVNEAINAALREYIER